MCRCASRPPCWQACRCWVRSWARWPPVTMSPGIRGIFNGTTNYILSTMASDAREYADVLGEAQARGYAEADPSQRRRGLRRGLQAGAAQHAWPGAAGLTSRGAPSACPTFGGEADRRHHRRQAQPHGRGRSPGHVPQARLARGARYDRRHVRGAVTPMAVKPPAHATGPPMDVTNVRRVRSADPARARDLDGRSRRRRTPDLERHPRRRAGPGPLVPARPGGSSARRRRPCRARG